MRIDDLTFVFRRWIKDDQGEALRRMKAAERRARTCRAQEFNEGASAMRSLACSATPTVCLGQSRDFDGLPFPLLLPLAQMKTGGHMLFTGATGSGKTALAIVLLAQLLARDPWRATEIIVEPKRDLAPFIRDVLVPSLVASLPEKAAEALATRFIALNVFDPGSVVPFQILTPDPTLTINEQAFEVTTSFTRTVGLRDIGPLQETTLRLAFTVGIDLGLTLQEVLRFLGDEMYRRTLVPSIRHAEARDYFERRFTRERPSGIAALQNRLAALLAVPGLSRLLGGAGMVRFPSLLNGYVTVIDLSGAPAGMREVQRFIGELMIARLVRAAFARRVTQETLPVGLWLDEFQDIVTPELASDAERVFAQARSQRCFLRILHQSGAQFTDANFLRILRSQSNFHAVFRSDEQDARYLEPFLPVLQDGARTDTAEPFSDPEARAARRALLEVVPRLPDRTFLWWDKRQPYPAILAAPPTYPFARVRETAAALPPVLRNFFRSGVVEKVTEMPAVPPSPQQEPQPVDGCPEAPSPRPPAAEVRMTRPSNQAVESQGSQPTQPLRSRTIPRRIRLG